MSSPAPAVASERHQVLVIGGGNAGLSVAGRLHRYGVNDVAVIEPRAEHRYQPLFSHVAGGRARLSSTVRPQASAFPRGVQWIQDAATTIDADTRTVTLESGDTVGYEHLIVCPGIQRDWGRIPGLADAVQTPQVASHYEFELVNKTSRLLRDLRAGTAVFVEPPGPGSCSGAAQKPMYLACDYWRRSGVLDGIRVVLVVPGETVFGIPLIDQELDRKIAEYGIELRTSSELLAVDGVDRIATIGSAGGAAGERIAYDVLNVVPPQSAPDWLRSTGLAAADDPLGFVDVDPETLQHRRHPQIWALGDAAATRNSKSGGALRKQTTVVAKNLVAALNSKPPSARYDDYSVAPFTVSRHTVVFAEFDDQYRPQPTIPFWPDLARERRLTWVFDRYILPWVYWHLILKGRA
ncbi:MAG: NAD(P)/FAD-dependent oxidoreductase [Micrococcales bacterium]|nr:NAD(P)/FAD-dependent oxidoreductase [Micrococcales bacterium]